MCSLMFSRASAQVKIVDSVVALVFVDVMHDFAVSEISAQVLFHDSPVFKDWPQPVFGVSGDDMAALGEFPARSSGSDSQTFCSGGYLRLASAKTLSDFCQPVDPASSPNNLILIRSPSAEHQLW